MKFHGVHVKIKELIDEGRLVSDDQWCRILNHTTARSPLALGYRSAETE